MASKKTNSTIKKTASKTVKKNAKKAAKKLQKKHPVLFVFIVIIILALLVAFAYFFILPNLEGGNNQESSSANNTSSSQQVSSTEVVVDGNITENIILDDFAIHFMTLGNEYAGDSVYIKAGDTDIVIDAGSRQASTKTTEAYIDRYCTDGKLEYAILTHGDQDHIEGFTDTTNQKGLLSYYQIGTIIDNQYSNKSTQGYKKYTELRDSLVTKGTKHYTADECFNNENGASRQFVLSDKVTMDIIYNKYYFEKGSDENNYSVCTMFTYTNNNESHYFLLTGDLEKEGEESIAAYYDGSDKEHTLPKMDLFKAGHHGSKTSSNDCLLNIIQPKMCVVSCCCGVDEYTGILDNTFPTQQFINRIAKYTDRVYATSVYESYEIATAGSKTDKNGNVSSDKTGVAIGGNYVHTTGYTALNGNVVVSAGLSDGNVTIGLYCSNNTTKLKDSAWFNTEVVIDGKTRKMRTWPNA